MAIYIDEEDPNVVQWEKRQRKENRKRDKFSKQVKNKRKNK